MEVKNNLVNDTQEKMTFSQAIKTEQYQKLISTTLRDTKRANRFVASVVSAVSANPLLQDCTPQSIISSALQGEALELSPSQTLGEYYLVPYKKTVKDIKENFVKISLCQFQIGTAGRIQLAMRTGLYRDLDAMEIREGEYKGKDKRTGKPVVEFIEDDDERESKAIIGYYAYYELLNGFFKAIYLTKAKVIEHAKRFSKAFNYEVYVKVKNGEELDWQEKLKAETPWIQHFDEMAKNLALRKVLKNAPKSIEMRTAEEYEEKNENTIAEVFTPTDAQNDFFAIEEEQPTMIETSTEETDQQKETKTRKKKETPEQKGFLQG